jgi:glycosyltransferase involved in cell wall biosynthesis
VTPLRLTVAICTWNRHALLRQTLEQMTRLIIPADVEWELLVVNNNSTDATDAVLAEFAGRLSLRRVFEPTPGKSHALNRAAREAAGDYIIWTDDDALVDPMWVAEYVRAFRRWPECALFGGHVAAWFEGTPPEWLEPLIRSEYQVSCVYALRNLGTEPLPISSDRLPSGASTLPYGVNMAVRREVQLRFPYDPELGLRPGSHIRGEGGGRDSRDAQGGHHRVVAAQCPGAAFHPAVAPDRHIPSAVVSRGRRGEGQGDA